MASCSLLLSCMWFLVAYASLLSVNWTFLSQRNSRATRGRGDLTKTRMQERLVRGLFPPRRPMRLLVVTCIVPSSSWGIGMKLEVCINIIQFDHVFKRQFDEQECLSKSSSSPDTQGPHLHNGVALAVHLPVVSRDLYGTCTVIPSPACY
jgi:hypothetical protein